MADYYSLLSRAVSALPHSAPESRQAVYERARKALFSQLRSIQPPVAEADIEAEGRALDEAIARLELEAVRAATALSPSERSAGKPTGRGSAKPPAPKPSAVKSFGAKPSTDKPSADKPPAPKPAAPPQDAVASEAAASEPVAPEPSPQPQRPAAPLPSLPQPASNSRRMLAIGAVLIVVVGLVALLALQLRERPEDLARLKPEASTPETSESGKIADRVGDEVDRDSAPPSVARTAPEGAPSGPAVAVAQKAELWISAPEEQNKVKTYPGTVVWRLDSVASGPGQPLTPAIRGDIDIPTAKLKLALVFQKNSDPTLSASHTINASFQIAPGGDLQGVKAIGPIQMRRPEAQSGEQVAGVPVPITENNFLIGLLRGGREARNLTLLRAPMVLDLPMQLADGRAATISLEKGPGGERVFIDALDAWTQK
ncbi:MAG: hypothetical protein C3F11_16075 [Methylocystaceae bacterium]|nr:MAG: hypothetical protein C3F11_16075 [Methylocystaceae bacterium]